MSTFLRCALCAVALIIATQLVQAQTVSVSPGTLTVHLPDQFSLNVNVSTVTDLHAANVRLVFNHDILQYKQVSLGSFLPGAFMPQPLVSPGLQFDTVNVDQAVLGAGGNSGSGTLLEFQFKAQAIGSTPIILQSVDLRSTSNAVIACSTVDGTVTVDPVLPITLVSFSVKLASENSALLTWKTVSETNNYGFMVQRRAEGVVEFSDVPNSFTAGHGTTIDPHEYSFIDASAGTGTWYYRLKQMDLNGDAHFSDAILLSIATGVAEPSSPGAFVLEQNYPNPFNPETGVRFQVPALRGVEGSGASDVKITVYDVLGREVAVLVNERKAAGTYTVRFDGTGLASGVYVYRLAAGSFVQSRTMVLLK